MAFSILDNMFDKMKNNPDGFVPKEFDYTYSVFNENSVEFSEVFGN